MLSKVLTQIGGKHSDWVNTFCCCFYSNNTRTCSQWLCKQRQRVHFLITRKHGGGQSWKLASRKCKESNWTRSSPVFKPNPSDFIISILTSKHTNCSMPVVDQIVHQQQHNCNVLSSILPWELCYQSHCCLPSISCLSTILQYLKKKVTKLEQVGCFIKHHDSGMSVWHSLHWSNNNFCCLLFWSKTRLYFICQYLWEELLNNFWGAQEESVPLANIRYGMWVCEKSFIIWTFVMQTFPLPREIPMKLHCY